MRNPLKDILVFSKFFKPQRPEMSSHESYLNLAGQMAKKHKHPAAERNKQPILEALQLYIDKTRNAKLLEISSGSGQHVAHIAPNFPNVEFQPTEYERSSISSIELYRRDCPTNNIKEPQFLDAKDPVEKWLDGTLIPNSYDYMLNINLIHISEWACAEGLFKGGGILLKTGGYLFTYGPYAVDGKITPESNINFDAMLRQENPAWGLRDIFRDLEPLALKNGLILKNIHDLPANNKFLVWEKKE